MDRTSWRPKLFAVVLFAAFCVVLPAKLAAQDQIIASTFNSSDCFYPGVHSAFCSTYGSAVCLLGGFDEVQNSAYANSCVNLVTVEAFTGILNDMSGLDAVAAVVWDGGDFEADNIKYCDGTTDNTKEQNGTC